MRICVRSTYISQAKLQTQTNVPLLWPQYKHYNNNIVKLVMKTVNKEMIWEVLYMEMYYLSYSKQLMF